MPAIVDRLSANVACPRRVGRPSADYPRPFAGYRFIAGRELCQAAPPADRRTRLAEELGKFLGSLHAISAAEASHLGAPTDNLGRLNIKRRSEQTREQLLKAAEQGLIDYPTRWERLLDKLLSVCPEPRRACVVHGDLYSRHVIVEATESCQHEDARLAGIIDWGDVHVGDPAIDLSCAWSLFDVHGRQQLLRAYGPVDSGTLTLARFRALAHSAICLVYGREAQLPELELASKDALHWLLEE